MGARGRGCACAWVRGDACDFWCVGASVHARGRAGKREGIYVGVPTIIGNKGVEKIIEINLNEIEKLNFSKSIDSVKNLIDACKKIDQEL